MTFIYDRGVDKLKKKKKENTCVTLFIFNAGTVCFPLYLFFNVIATILVILLLILSTKPIPLNPKHTKVILSFYEDTLRS